MRDLLIRPSLAEVGKLKLGTKDFDSPRRSADGRVWYPPKKLDNWLVTTTARDERGELIPDRPVMDKIGQTTELDVVLPYDDIGLNFYTFRAARKGSRYACTSRGLTDVTREGKAHRFAARDSASGETTWFSDPLLVNCPCPWLEAGFCKPFGLLRVLLPAAPVLGGFYVFRTASWNTCRNIISSLAFYATLTRGRLAGLQFLLRCGPQTVEDRERKTRTIVTANLVYRGTTSEFLLEASQILRERQELDEALRQLALPEPEEVVVAAEGQAKAEILEPETPEQIDEDGKEFQPGTAPEGDREPAPDLACPNCGKPWAGCQGTCVADGDWDPDIPC